MKTVILQTVEDEYTGEIGLRLKELPHIDDVSVATSGELIAHDLIEHQRGINNIGTIGDELIACGGIWYTRGALYDMSRPNYSRYTPEQNIAQEVARMYHPDLDLEYDLGVPDTKIKFPGENATVKEILLWSKNYIKSDRYDSPVDRRHIKAYLKRAKWLIREGLSLAHQRFDNHLVANRMYWNIATAVDPYAKDAEIVGQEYKLTYDTTSAFCEEYYKQ